MDSLRSELNFQLSVEDTTPPRLISAVSKDNSHVEIEFSESIDLTPLALADFSISDTGRTRNLRIVDFFPHFENPAHVMLITEPQHQDSLYKVFVTGVKDLAGHVINQLASSKQYTRASVHDTMPPGLITATVMDSTTRFPMDQRFQFDFDDALQQRSAEHAVHLRGKDSVEIPLHFVWNSSASFSVVPLVALRQDYFYTFFVRFDSLRDGAGNHWKDRTRSFSFRTIDPEQLSSIEGMLVDPDTSHADKYIVVAENTAKKVKKMIRVTTQRGKKFLFPQLDAGEYQLKAFQDDYNSGVY